MNRTSFWVTLCVAAVLCLSACGDKYEPVAAKQCSTLVKHARALLGKRADPYSEMMATCRAATDQKRGCAMAADSAADLMRCSM